MSASSRLPEPVIASAERAENGRHKLLFADGQGSLIIDCRQNQLHLDQGPGGGRLRRLILPFREALALGLHWLRADDVWQDNNGATHTAPAYRLVLVALSKHGQRHQAWVIGRTPMGSDTSQEDLEKSIADLVADVAQWTEGVNEDLNLLRNGKIALSVGRPSFGLPRNSGSYAAQRERVESANRRNDS